MELMEETKLERRYRDAAGQIHSVRVETFVWRSVTASIAVTHSELWGRLRVLALEGIDREMAKQGMEATGPTVIDVTPPYPVYDEDGSWLGEQVCVFAERAFWPPMPTEPGED